VIEVIAPARALPKNVLIVGMGGLGCPAALALFAAGVHELTFADPDVVDLTNLHRQPWHRTSDLGKPKVESAAVKLKRLWSKGKYTALQQKVDVSNVDGLFAQHEAVIDATDGAETKFLLNDAAVRSGKTLVYGGAIRLEGQAMVIRKDGPCLRCLFEAPPPEMQSCAQAGVLGSLAGAVGALQVRLLLAAPEASGTATLHRIDAAKLETRQVAVKKAADCPVCALKSA
jgi:molybdopterin-synthase adenylyltransferase